jgi:hypothetical protein
MKHTRSHNLFNAANRLRDVKNASRLFFALWALQKSPTDHATALAESDGVGDSDAIADPNNHDWSLLYRGDVLDD